MTVLPVAIAATGIYRPRTTIASTDIDATHAWPHGRSERLTGIASRAVAADDECASMMASEAVRAALAGDTSGPLDRLVVASIMSEQPIPTTAALAARRLGLDRIAAYDINASCLGFLQAVEGAAAAITLGASTRAAVAAVDIASLGLDREDPATAPLFGDGAAAAVLQRSDGASAILAIRLETHPDGADLCEIPAGGSRWNPRRPPPSESDYLFRMNGAALARLAMERLPDFISRVLDEAGVRLGDIACVMPHQASRLGLRFLERLLGDHGAAMVDILADHGNQVSASLPTTLHHAIESGRLHRGDLGLMLGTAAGFGMGAMVFKY
ncbi:ketoacyl-ACP synthase III [Bradyrhizobium sp. U87765 SZCCT0131]|uniref:3-oxoacyl-ACP synthase III family protein n=1 Tax=unclassified Bradyrhizobium TaxID=2631580 RepID=UPI001BA69F3C|nr:MULTISPECIES: 3-oxoacyl-[acyl-carrier-protein] synthase III C-terminal domain-containing protein [unclassified Bradyrhizobium]MBR1216358.1 ketoacyl-ACP synthase III [Bradyrhizobium sp. U87765 SZCCT0131]MBR1259894.1 ketoacyl-ACP synthase III [Bradyrhizobium sp. U87765 SZCCT0134]MBR1306027.1 ketoacyl-ACP synthase III [Bradyrhizobium sp. U87765 SZCCT0110]MBR1322394.1 ketoacyl-ACP synthase III [Bradyrhizobium sp. U87765 SZCCT0109]MBR1352315.1 ketoacyl-ACP synthase III [Bradyrhizobium sp. U87765